MRVEALRQLGDFIEVIERLRAPGGCPWDRQQTHASLAPFLLEETYEALDAIENGAGSLREELGDLLLQVVLHAVIAAEDGRDEGGFDIGDVADSVRAKMVHRHPHVFAGTAVTGADEVVVNWEKLKAAEKTDRLSLLDGIPAAMPALARTQSAQKRPARIGFDPASGPSGAVTAIREALDAVERAAPGRRDIEPEDGWTATDGGFFRAGSATTGDPSAPPDAAITGAIGDLLFAAVALARGCGVDAETALLARANDFILRFKRLEAGARADGVDLHALDAAEWLQRWDDAETAPRPGSA